MILKIALRNFFGQGMRAVLNVFVTALIIIATIFSLSLLNGFQAQALKNMSVTDAGGGHYRVPGFDILSPMDWEDLTRTVPEQLKRLPPGQKAEVLVQQGTLFVHQHLFPVQLRGVEMAQELLDLPLQKLKTWNSPVQDTVPVVIGRQMAKASRLKAGDLVVMKWRDKFGAVDALDAEIVDVVPLVNPRVDEGVAWLRLDHLRQITQRPGEITWVVVEGNLGAVDGLEFLDVDHLMNDLLSLLKHDRRNTRILWIILLLLAGISVFNTQYLNIFKRQKEIGTLLAMGMTPSRVVRLFTLEGSLAAFGAVVLTALLGIPFFAWFQTVGFDVSHLSETGIPVRENIFLVFRPGEIASSVLITVSLMLVVAWWPVRRISRLDPTLALRGRGIT